MAIMGLLLLTSSDELRDDSNAKGRLDFLLF